MPGRYVIAYFFETFSRVGSASRTVKVFRNEGLRFPPRIRNEKLITFQPLTASTALRTLNNPRYAGTYVYGRRHYRRTADGKHVLRKRERHRRESARPCCRGARSAGFAVETSVSGIQRGASDRRRGVSAIARKERVVNRAASRLRADPSTKRSVDWSPP
ncbi:recombinase family protein [Cupriavidus sp. KK10]|uniref:recombinase family protein n=1 Tax=Cupriavidus sp. KK10 TaxID=1478019 RepID=UPI0035303A5D